VYSGAGFGWEKEGEHERERKGRGEEEGGRKDVCNARIDTFILQQLRYTPECLVWLIPRLHDEAGSTSWLYERS